MIILGSDNKKPSNNVQASGQGPSTSGGSNTHHLLINMSASSGPIEPPPAFSPYVAEFSLTGTRDVISHDSHLNTDGEALYRFLLAQSQVLPTLRIHFKGTHTEYRQRWVSSTDTQGRHTNRTETYSETVTDFNFCIEVCPQHLLPPGANAESGYTPIHWSVADDEPVYRGKMIREYELPSDTSTTTALLDSANKTPRRKKATRHEIKQHQRWLDKKKQLGYPPWIQENEENLYLDGIMLTADDSPTLQSSKTLREWADEYCASPKYLKEFRYEKTLYGWNLVQLERSLRSLILSAPYNGETSISFTTYSSKIYIRSSNRVSRMLSNIWLKLLSIILLIFPFIWLFKRFHKKGGGTWQVCGGAYPLKQWVPLGEGETVPTDQQGSQEDTLPPYHPDSNSWSSSGSTRFSPTSPFFGPPSARSPTNSNPHSTRYIHTASGMRKLVGIREGEWFRNWEGVIVRAVIGRYQSTEPMRSDMLSPASALGGYNEATGLLVEV